MADLRIVDSPEIPTENITGEEKLPTGGSGNYSISLDSLADYTKTKKDLADNASVDGKINGVRQELDAHIEDLLNPHQVTKGQVGLGNVDNTADADKPVSNSTQAAIISAVTPKADKSYVDSQLTLKANKADVYTKSETYTKQESSDLVNNSISTALTPVNTALDLAKRGIANRYDQLLTYNSGERVVLTNGDIVKSTIDGNTNDPNVDMTGWVNPEEDQRKINDRKYVSPFDFGYSGGDDDYGYYLQLAIDSGKNVYGATGPTSVKSSTIVFISKSGQSVDLSMINNVDWFGDYEVYSSSSDRSIGVFNIAPESASLSNTTTVSTMPLVDSNMITLSIGHGFKVGDFVRLDITYPTGVYTNMRAATVIESSETFIKLDYAFGYSPSTLTINRVNNYVSGVRFKAPQKITDNSGATASRNLVSGIGVRYARYCSINASNLINGANPSLIYYQCVGCEDFFASATKPRFTAGGQGYAVQVNGSYNITSNNPFNIQGRHVIDYTGSSFSRVFRPKARAMLQIPIITHGQYEHDIDIYNPDVDDCSHLTSVGGRAYQVASSGADFGERAKRVCMHSGEIGGAVYQNLNVESCEILSGTQVKSVNNSLICCVGNPKIEANFREATVELQGASTGNVTLSDTIARTIDCKSGLFDLIITGASKIKNITASTTAKPASILISGEATLSPDNNFDLTTNTSITFSGNSAVVGTSTRQPTLRSPSIDFGQNVELRGSTGFNLYASDVLRFCGKFVNPTSGRTAPTLNSMSSSNRVEVIGADMPVYEATVRALLVNASATDVVVIMSNNYIEGLVQNVVSGTSVTKCIVSNNIVKDDAALKAATTSGTKVFQNNI